MKKDFKEIFPVEVVAVQGKPYMFTNARIDRNTVPDHLHAYDVADDSGDGEFWRIQKFVYVDHWGTIIGWEELNLDKNGQLWCEPDKDHPGHSSEGTFIGQTMDGPEDFIIWYGALKGITKAAGGAK